MTTWNSTSYAPQTVYPRSSTMGYVHPPQAPTPAPDWPTITNVGLTHSFMLDGVARAVWCLCGNWWRPVEDWANESEVDGHLALFREHVLEAL